MSKPKKKEQKIRFEEELFRAADKLRKNIGADEYKHVVLGLIFLRFVSNTFNEKYNELVQFQKQGTDADPEEKLEYKSKNLFWVPEDARWKKIRNSAKLPDIGTIIDDAMDLIEQENDSLKGVLPQDYARPALDKQKLGELIDLISSIDTEKPHLPKDILGRIYEYFLGRFASVSDDAGQFYTPQTVVELLVNMIEPFQGRVFDPCCGSGGMFIQSQRFVEIQENNHGKGDLAIFGQESNRTTWKLCKMNLALHKMENSNIKWGNEGSFLNDLHPTLHADFILANPPFNDSDWNGAQLKEDERWKDNGIPPENNANFAWVQHFIHHLDDDGIAAFLLANGSLSSTKESDEYLIRKSIINHDLVDCIITLPNKLFYSTQVPVCVWIITKNKENPKFRKRKEEILFIHAKNKGRLIPGSRRNRELPKEDIALIKNTYHAWRGETKNDEYQDIPGFCYSATINDCKSHHYALVPGRYTGSEEIIDEEEDFSLKLQELQELLEKQIKLSSTQTKKINENIGRFLKNDKAST